MWCNFFHFQNKLFLVESWHCLPNNFSTRSYTNAKHSTRKKICSDRIKQFFVEISKIVLKKIEPLGKNLQLPALDYMNGHSSCNHIFIMMYHNVDWDMAGDKIPYIHALHIRNGGPCVLLSWRIILNTIPLFFQQMQEDRLSPPRRFFLASKIQQLNI